MAKTVKVVTQRPGSSRMKMRNSGQMTGRQKYKLEKQKLANQRAATNVKADTIRAIGVATAQSVVPSVTTGVASATSTKAIQAANSLVRAEAEQQSTTTNPDRQADSGKDENVNTDDRW